MVGPSRFYADKTIGKPSLFECFMETAPNRILIIDDSVDGKSALERHLLSENIVIEVAHDAIDGLITAERNPPDLLLVDIANSTVDMYGIVFSFRKSVYLSELPIVMVTGLSDVDMRIKAFQAGADDVIQKPYHEAELKAIVRNVMKLNRFRKLADQRHQLERMLTHLENSYDATIEGWMKALDLRDQETEGHSLRVAELTVLLARQMGVHGDHLLNIRRGALLHDIGKLAIPDSVLKKPGALTPEERLLINKHPMFAHEMLYGIEYLRPSLDIPVYHHEKWDGSGYPFRLKGDQIPFSARLFAIIDVYDALSFDRPYRKAVPQDEVIEYLKSQREIHFDPNVCDEFLDLLQRIGDPAIRAKLWDRAA